MPEQEEGTSNVQQNIPNRPKDLTEVSRAVLRSEQAKRWTKKYRTEVAASSSSLLSTFAAVGELRLDVLLEMFWLTSPSIPSTRSRLASKRMPAF